MVIFVIFPHNNNLGVKMKISKLLRIQPKLNNLMKVYVPQFLGMFDKK